MHKKHFTEAEIDLLRTLFQKKETAGHSKQKAIRAKMREIGFYITDYAESMNLSDFERLVNSWKREIPNTEEKDFPKDLHIEKKSNYLHMTSSNEAPIKNLKNGLEPWVGDSPRVLILGTLPSDVSLKEQAYYQNKSRNSFWKIMHSLWPNDKNLNDKVFVQSHQIALWDCLHSATRKGSTDEGFGKNMEPNDLEAFLQKYPSIKDIILNGTGKTKELFDTYFGKLRNHYIVVPLTSTSNANTKSFEVKLSEWQKLKRICDTH